MAKVVEWHCDRCHRPLDPGREFVELVDGVEVGRYHFCDDGAGHWESCMEKWAHDRRFSQQMEGHTQAFLARQSAKEN